MSDDIVVVGAGVAGVHCVRKLRELGYGGKLCLIGGEDYPPYDRPPLSKRALAGDVRVDEICLLTDTDRDALQVDWIGGAQAVELLSEQQQVRLHDGRRIPYGRLILATGARPKRLPNVPTLRGVFELRTYDDARKLRTAAGRARSICVIGGGVLGCEIAATLTHLNVPVTLLEAQDALLIRALGRSELARAVAARHEHAGVTVRLGQGVASLAGTDTVEGVVMTDGSMIVADLVVVALGVAPDTDWLSSSGLSLADGIVCDPYLRTNLAGIYAAGDAARITDPRAGTSQRHEHWTAAGAQGDLAAVNILAGDGASLAYRELAYMWSDQYGRKIQTLGAPQLGDCETVLARDDEAGRMLALYSRNGSLCGAAAMGTPARLMTFQQAVAAAQPLAEVLAVS